MQRMLEWINTHVLWGLPMVVLLLGVGVFLAVVTKGRLYRRPDLLLRNTVGTLCRPSPRKAEGVTPFQALCTALAATVGTGNIAGVSLAIAAGGPGAIFWIWVSALVGMVTKYAEVILAVAYRQKNADGETVGGPMYYMEWGLGRRKAALVFSALGSLAAFGIGAGVQGNALATSLQQAFSWRRDAVGVVIALLAGLVIIGGIRRISSAAQVLVPFMSLFYVVGAAVVLAKYHHAIPTAFRLILEGAFRGTAAVGGFAGATVGYVCRVGMARGTFTHEAGMGSAPIAHAAADTDHPARQGLWGAAEVFLDSVVMCTVTALVLLTTEAWKLPTAGTAACAAAFEQGFSGGGYVVYIGLSLFAFATVIAWFYYGQRCVAYLFPSGKAEGVYPYLYVLVVFAGSVISADTAWAFADTCNGLMALPNLAALLRLSPVVRRLSEDFYRRPNRRRRGEEAWRGIPLVTLGGCVGAKISCQRGKTRV